MFINLIWYSIHTRNIHTLFFIITGGYKLKLQTNFPYILIA